MKSIFWNNWSLLKSTALCLPHRNSWHLSQPALTRSMRKLEEVIGVPLFERTKNRIALNENGRLTAQYAQKILEQERDMVERVRLLDRSRRTITLGSCAPVPIADLVPVLSRLLHRDDHCIRDPELG